MGSVIWVATRSLTVPSGNSDGSAVQHRAREPAQLPSHVPSPSVAGKESNLKFIAVSKAKLFLRGVKQSAHGFPPLKSVAEVLCFILNNCEVWFPSCTFNPHCLQPLQQTEVNKKAIESLAPRIKMLSESLGAPIHPSDVNEKERESELGW